MQIVENYNYLGINIHINSHFHIPVQSIVYIGKDIVRKMGRERDRERDRGKGWDRKKKNGFVIF